MAKITENTLMPLSLVITLAGGIIFVTMMWSKVEAYSVKVDKQEDNQMVIIKDLARIKEKLGISE